MSNTLITPVKVLRESLRILHNNLAFTKGVNREYSDEFAQSGGKVGQSVNVRKPNRYYVSDGQSLDVQDTSEEYVQVTLDHQFHVDVNFTSKDLTLSLDDFSERILKPAMARLASKIDHSGLGEYINIYNWVGTPGTEPGVSGGSGLATSTAPQVFLNAGALLDSMATPRDGNRSCILSPFAQSASIAGLSGLFNDQGALGDQYRKGVMGRALGFEFAMDQNINAFNTGTYSGTAANFDVNGAQGDSTTAISTLTCKWTSDGSGTLEKGTVFDIAGVYSVNPETGESTGQLQPFVVTEDATIDQTTFDISISPPILFNKNGTTAKATVYSSTGDVADGSQITIRSGATAGNYTQNLAYHKDAFTLATADLIMPKGVDFSARESFDGISMRIVRQYDISNDSLPCRIDVLCGWKTTRPEMAVRIFGA